VRSKEETEDEEKKGAGAERCSDDITNSKQKEGEGGEEEGGEEEGKNGGVKPAGDVLDAAHVTTRVEVGGIDSPFAVVLKTMSPAPLVGVPWHCALKKKVCDVGPVTCLK
jgi:hypothetical protein